jgi:hypothetical protein
MLGMFQKVPENWGNMPVFWNAGRFLGKKIVDFGDLESERGNT